MELIEKYFKIWRWNCGIIKDNEEYSDLFYEHFYVETRTQEEIFRDENHYID